MILLRSVILFLFLGLVVSCSGDDGGAGSDNSMGLRSRFIGTWVLKQQFIEGDENNDEGYLQCEKGKSESVFMAESFVANSYILKNSDDMDCTLEVFEGSWSVDGSLNTLSVTTPEIGNFGVRFIFQDDNTLKLLYTIISKEDGLTKNVEEVYTRVLE